MGQGEQLRQIDSELSQSKEMGDRRWSVNSVGQTMVRIDGPLKFRMGVPGNDPDYQDEIKHRADDSAPVCDRRDGGFDRRIRGILEKTLREFSEVQIRQPNRTKTCRAAA